MPRLLSVSEGFRASISLGEGLHLTRRPLPELNNGGRGVSYALWATPCEEDSLQFVCF
jgi:hypothetical protein